MHRELRRYWPQIKGGNSGFILAYPLELDFFYDERFHYRKHHSEALKSN